MRGILLRRRHYWLGTRVVAVLGKLVADEACVVYCGGGALVAETTVVRRCCEHHHLRERPTTFSKFANSCEMNNVFEFRKFLSIVFVYPGALTCELLLQSKILAEINWKSSL